MAGERQGIGSKIMQFIMRSTPKENQVETEEEKKRREEMNARRKKIAERLFGEVGGKK